MSVSQFIIGVVARLAPSLKSTIIVEPKLDSADSVSFHFPLRQARAFYPRNQPSTNAIEASPNSIATFPTAT